jgi:Protein of unknown function (DUF3040)
MALSMDEQRMLAEIERRLAAEDPGLAARLSSFRRPGPTMALRSSRVRIFGSVLTVALVAVVSLMVYAMIPLRSHSARLGGRQATPTNGVLTQPGASPGAGGKPAGASTAATGMTTAAMAPQGTSPASQQGTSSGSQSSPATARNARASKSATIPAGAHAP